MPVMIFEASIKDTQAELLILLEEFDRICRQNNIKYSLHGGTLLGAIRHKGFIPWDDDIDVTLERKEYKKLAKCFNEQSKDFQIIETYLHMPKMVRKRFGKDTVFAWIDIIVYDYITEKPLGRKCKIGLSLAFEAMCRDKSTIRLSVNKGHNPFKMAFFWMAYIIGKPFSYNTKYGWYNQFCEKMLCGKKEWIYRSNDSMFGMSIKTRASWMTEYIDIPFEGRLFMVMKDYHEVLVSIFGDNYMVPVQDGAKRDVHLNYKRAFVQHLKQKVQK